MSAALPRPMIELSFRRAALMTGADAPLQDVIDLAELALVADDRTGALLLFGIVALERGFGDDGLRWQADVAARTGLWQAPTVPALGGRNSMLDRALGELRRLCTLPLPFVEWPTRAELTVPDAQPVDPAELPLQALRAFRDMIVPPLRLALEQGGDAALAPLFDTVLQATHGWGEIDLSKYAGCDATTLACVVGYCRLGRLTRFVAELRAIGWGDLVEPAARLSGDGLGSFFANVPRLVCRPDDLAGFVHLAAPGPLDRDSEAGWLVALTVQVPTRMARDLAYLCARRGMRGALRSLVRRGLVIGEREWLWAVRDAALTFGHGWIAAEAQHALLVLSPASYSEAAILADMLGLLGEVEAAAAAFERCFLLAPGSDLLLRRRAALGTEAFEELARSSGFFAERERRHVLLTPGSLAIEGQETAGANRA